MPSRQDETHFSYQTELDGKTYGFEFMWNSRAGYWFMSITDKDGNPLLMGRKLVLNWPLTGRFRNNALPPGAFVLFDTSGRDVEPNEKELGTRCQLVYHEAAELE